MFVVTSVAVYKNYISRPGFLEADALQITEKGTDYVTLKWDAARNAERYVIEYENAEGEKQSVEVDGDKTQARIDGLDEGQTYDFSIRAEREDHDSNIASSGTVKTKMSQKVEGKLQQMKLSETENVDLGIQAETPVEYESSDESVIAVDSQGNLKATGAGEATVTVKAAETDDYAADTMVVDVNVLDSVSKEASNADIHVLYSINEDNCEKIMTVTGDGDIDIPQSLAYTKGKYTVAYGMYDGERLITFDGENKSIDNPDISLGHPNGLTYAESTGKYYSVRGSSALCIIYDPETDTYDMTELSYGASGICYDREKNLFYASAKNRLVVYSGDGEFEVVRTVSVVDHGEHYPQDCGGYGGIMMKCISTTDRHEVNYVDLYDMINGRYLGSVKCNLSEVESAIVDDEGYMELLCNTTDTEDYIWKTPINIADLAKDIQPKDE